MEELSESQGQSVILGHKNKILFQKTVDYDWGRYWMSASVFHLWTQRHTCTDIIYHTHPHTHTHIFKKEKKLGYGAVCL